MKNRRRVDSIFQCIVNCGRISSGRSRINCCVVLFSTPNLEVDAFANRPSATGTLAIDNDAGHFVPVATRTAATPPCLNANTFIDVQFLP